MRHGRHGHGGLARLALLAVGVVVLLSGCFNVDVKIALDSEALASGTFKVEVTKQVAALAGITSAQALKDVMLSNEDSPMPEGSSIDTKETDTSYVMTVNLVNAPLTDNDMRAEVLPDGRIKFSFKQEGSTDPSGSAMGLGMGSMKLEITFPGKVIEASPDFSNVGNNSVSLSTTLDKSFDIYAISEAGGSGSSSPILPIVVVLVVLMLIGVGVMRNRASAAKVAHVELTDQAGQVNEPQPGE
ncbi:MAG: hypothetical protein ACYC06_06430 [Ilumatobacteraceae bacterium]